MANTNATNFRAVTVDLPESPGISIEFMLKTTIISGAEFIGAKETWVLYLDANGVGQINLPTPDNTGSLSSNYAVSLPGVGSRSFNLTYSASSVELSELLAAYDGSVDPGEVEMLLQSYLRLSGGTLTGALTLSGAPTVDLHAATKLYVDSGAGGGIAFDGVVFVAKVGNDANDGNWIGSPKLTIGAAITTASALLTAGADGVRIEVMDGETYTENIVVPENVSVDAIGATLVGSAEITSNSELYLDRHYASANNQNMLSLNAAAAGPGLYSANISDGRGLGGALTGTTNVRNVGGGGKNLFARVGVLYVAQSGIGVGDVSSGDAGHIHISLSDLYLAGNNAVGVLGGAQGAGSANVVGWIDHILEINAPTTTVGISMTAAGAVVKLTASEIVADTAYSVVAGSLYLACPKITGTRTGTPINRMIGTEDIGTAAGTVAAGNDARLVDSIVIACSDETTDLAIGTPVTFRMPYAMTLTAVRASVVTAPVGSALQVDINEGGVSILGTAITIDASEKTSTTAAVPAVISDTALADDAEITIDIDAVGSSTAGAGLKVTLIGSIT